MSSWEDLASAAIPGSTDRMRLVRRGDELRLLVGPTELMTNLARGSERALGTLGCRHLRDRPDARVLIGGLGMGFTLRAALATLRDDARVVVAELVPEVAEWARGPLRGAFGAALTDPRVDVRIEDVSRTIQSGPAAFDAILLDVDNGAVALTKHANRRLYDEWGLRRARYALRPGGILGVWSGRPDRRFKARLRRCGFEVEERRVHAEGANSRRHVLWFAALPPHDDFFGRAATSPETAEPPRP